MKLMETPWNEIAGYTEEMAERDMTDQKVQALAYELWLKRGSPIGSPEVDWALAEKMLGFNQLVGELAGCGRGEHVKLASPPKDDGLSRDTRLQ
jgi:hypothetical protein